MSIDLTDRARFVTAALATGTSPVSVHVDGGAVITGTLGAEFDVHDSAGNITALGVSITDSDGIKWVVNYGDVRAVGVSS